MAEIAVTKEHQSTECLNHSLDSFSFIVVRQAAVNGLNSLNSLNGPFLRYNPSHNATFRPTHSENYAIRFVVYMARIITSRLTHVNCSGIQT